MARKLSANQRGRVAEKIMEWGNLIFLGLIVAQIIPGPLVKPSLLFVGVISFAGAYWFAIRLMRGGG